VPWAAVRAHEAARAAHAGLAEPNRERHPGKARHACVAGRGRDPRGVLTLGGTAKNDHAEPELAGDARSKRGAVAFRPELGRAEGAARIDDDRRLARADADRGPGAVRRFVVAHRGGELESRRLLRAPERVSKPEVIVECRDG